jgi:hypothetical protein
MKNLFFFLLVLLGLHLYNLAHAQTVFPIITPRPNKPVGCISTCAPSIGTCTTICH